MKQILLIIIIISLLIDNILPFIIAPFYKTYKHKSDLLSILGSKESPVKNVYNIWCILSGLLFCIFGIIIYINDSNTNSLIILILSILYGLGCEIISGLSPISENIEDRSISTVVHGIGSVIGFMALLFIPFFIALDLANNRLESLIGFLCFSFDIISFCLFVMSDKPRFKKSFVSYMGLWQRLTIVFCYIPIIIFIINLLWWKDFIFENLYIIY